MRSYQRRGRGRPESARGKQLLAPALLGIFFVCAPASIGPKSAPEQPDIRRSGRDFLEVCSSVDGEGGIDSEGNRDPARIYRDAPAWRDATCLGWVEGFADGFLVHVRGRFLMYAWLDGLPILMADQEIIFTVEDAPEGGYTARALGYAIFTQGETLEELRQMVRDAVNCHFEKENKPKLIRLHMVKDEVIVA